MQETSFPEIKPVYSGVAGVGAGVMSARQDRGAKSGKRTRYDPRRGYDAASGLGRQPGSGNSGRYSGGGSGDTPPRFAHHRHHRNSDSRDGGYYHEDGGGGERGGGRRGGYSGKGRHYERDGSGWGGGGAGRGSVTKSTYGKGVWYRVS